MNGKNVRAIVWASLGALAMAAMLLIATDAWAETDRARAGARYQLSPAAPTAGEGCCCKTMLPCIIK